MISAQQQQQIYQNLMLQQARIKFLQQNGQNLPNLQLRQMLAARQMQQNSAAAAQAASAMPTLPASNSKSSDECSKRCRMKVKAQFNRLKVLLQTHYLKTQLEKDAANSWTRFQLVAHIIAFIKQLRRKLNLPCAPGLHEMIDADIELEIIKAPGNVTDIAKIRQTTGTSSSSPTSSRSNLSNSSDEGNSAKKEKNSNWKSCAAYRSRLNKSLKLLRATLDHHSTLIAASRSASRAGLLDATGDYLQQLIRGEVNFSVSSKSVAPNTSGPVMKPVVPVLAQKSAAATSVQMPVNSMATQVSNPAGPQIQIPQNLLHQIFPHMSVQAQAQMSGMVTPHNNQTQKAMAVAQQNLPNLASEPKPVQNIFKRKFEEEPEILVDIESDDEIDLKKMLPYATSSPKPKSPKIWRPYL